jgi:hypothetical protein
MFIPTPSFLYLTRTFKSTAVKTRNATTCVHKMLSHIHNFRPPLCFDEATPVIVTFTIAVVATATAVAATAAAATAIVVRSYNSNTILWSPSLLLLICFPIPVKKVIIMSFDVAFLARIIFIPVPA